MTYRLMIKTHNATNLKYLCITKREKYEEYLGSGTEWRKHLKKYGNDISTSVLFCSEDYPEFLEACLYYSALYDVALNEEFANVIPERGYDNYMGFNIGESNLTTWWKYATEEVKREVIEKRKIKQIENHWSKSDFRDETIDKIQYSFSRNSKEFIDSICEKLRQYGIAQWENIPIEERRELMKFAWEGAAKFYANKESDEYKEWLKNVGDATRIRMANTPFEILSERSRKSRLGLSPEKKQLRAERIGLAFKRGCYDENTKRMKTERLGINNPAARITVWFGEKYTASQFKQLKLKKRYIEEMFLVRDDCYRDYEENLKIYEILTCPHCNKQSSGKSPSGFKRWHFDNCKEKEMK